jgi:hypothetical protein
MRWWGRLATAPTGGTVRITDSINKKLIEKGVFWAGLILADLHSLLKPEETGMSFCVRKIGNSLAL